MAAAAMTGEATISSRRKSFWTGTPEIYFAKPIDNSRLVKVQDPRRSREMKHFAIALACLFLLVMTYALEHFKAIEYGYKIEALRSQRDSIAEMNRVLELDEAELRSPLRIDSIARQFGMQPPQAGQIIRLEPGPATASGPVMASVTPVSLISVR